VRPCSWDLVRGQLSAQVDHSRHVDIGQRFIPDARNKMHVQKVAVLLAGGRRQTTANYILRPPIVTGKLLEGLAAARVPKHRKRFVALLSLTDRRVPSVGVGFAVKCLGSGFVRVVPIADPVRPAPLSLDGLDAHSRAMSRKVVPLALLLRLRAVRVGPSRRASIQSCSGQYERGHRVRAR